MKSSMSEDLINGQGRQFSGCAITLRNSFSFDAQIVDKRSDRLIIIKLIYTNCKYLICNVYMPVNDTTVESYDEFGDILSEISSIMPIYEVYQIIIGGGY